MMMMLTADGELNGDDEYDSCDCGDDSDHDDVV